MDLAPGVYINDHLRLKVRLGEGGMASVWVAEHLSLKIDVAVKFIATDLAAQAPELVARFNREATAIARIKSPHVVQILDHGMTADGTPYIVMERLEGEDLGARLDREGQLRLDEVVAVMGQVAKALSRAHAVGIIHRDIKPDNIFLTRSDDDDEIFAKILDFGIAKDTKPQSYSVVTVTGTMVGTPAYMSPEQVLSGKHVDERSDLWSLGVVTYHALTGEVPFFGTTLGSLCVAISRGTFTAPSQVDSRLPQALDAWMLRALAQRPEDRFQTARDFAEALREAAASGLGTIDDVPPFSRPSTDWPSAPLVPSSLAPVMPSAPSLPGAVEAPPPGDAPVPVAALTSAIVLPKKRWLPSVATLGALALLGGFLVGGFLVATTVLGRSRPVQGAASVVHASESTQSVAAPAVEPEAAPVSADAAAPPAASVAPPTPNDSPAPVRPRKTKRKGSARAAEGVDGAGSASTPRPVTKSTPRSEPVPTSESSASSPDRGF